MVGITLKCIIFNVHIHILDFSYLIHFNGYLFISQLGHYVWVTVESLHFEA